MLGDSCVLTCFAQIQCVTALTLKLIHDMRSRRLRGIRSLKWKKLGKRHIGLKITRIVALEEKPRKTICVIVDGSQ
jgi:hypothetical protein